MIKIAITGSIGAGKSTVVKCIEEQGYRVLMSDEIVRELYRSNITLKNYIAQQYPMVLSQDQNLNKIALSKIVFSDRKKTIDLESVIFPLVQEKLSQVFDAFEGTLMFVEVPLLFEAKMEKLFDYIIVVDAPLNIRMHRLVKNRNMDLEDALIRNSRQFSSEFKKKNSDYVIINNKDYQVLELEVVQLIKKLEEKYARERKV